MTTPPAPLLDTAAALQNFDHDAEFYASLLHDFMATLPDLVAQTQLALTEGKPTQAATALHTIKGMTLALGAQALTDFAREHERLCKQEGTPLDAQAIVAALAAISHDTIAAMTRWLADSGLSAG